MRPPIATCEVDRSTGTPRRTPGLLATDLHMHTSNHIDVVTWLLSQNNYVVSWLLFPDSQGKQVDVAMEANLYGPVPVPASEDRHPLAPPEAKQDTAHYEIISHWQTTRSRHVFFFMTDIADRDASLVLNHNSVDLTARGDRSIIIVDPESSC